MSKVFLKLSRHYAFLVLIVVTLTTQAGCSKKARPISASKGLRPTTSTKIGAAGTTGDALKSATAANIVANTAANTAANIAANTATLTVPPVKHPPPPPVIAKVGGYAPDFVLPSVDGQTVRLSDHKGRTVVLEWFNPDCPFVRQAHTKGVLKTMARRWSAKGVFWIAINSSGVGRRGHGRDRNARAIETFDLDHALLLDETGMIGKKYGVNHTPHVFVIDGLGKLRYAGSVDNMPPGEISEPGAKPAPYLQQALEAVARGQDPAIRQTKSRGCSVKYAE